MSSVEFKRKDVISEDLESVPADTTLIILPMTLDRFGKEIESENELIMIDSIDSAFEVFKPSIYFTTVAGDEATEFVADLEFSDIESLSPEHIQKRVSGRRNDIADLKAAIDLLTHMKEKWMLPRVKRAWEDPLRQLQVSEALLCLQNGLEKFAQTRTQLEEIFTETPQIRPVLEKIFFDLHTWIEPEEGMLAELFTGVVANNFIAELKDFRTLILDTDTYDQTLQRFQERIDKAVHVRDEIMNRLFDQIRPLETSYRQLWLFYENTIVPDGKERPPVEVFIFNADAAAIQNRKSVMLKALSWVLGCRNDNYNLQDDIWYLVVPGPISMMVREALEEEAQKWDMLLITDLADDTSYHEISNQLAPGGRYEFLKRTDDKAAGDAVTVGYLKLRDHYWFEKDVVGEDGLYAPASIIFTGVLVRADRSHNSVVWGPLGTRFGQIKGVKNARIECLSDEDEKIEPFSTYLHAVAIVREANDNLYFYGPRFVANNSDALHRFFSSHQLFGFLKRVIYLYLSSHRGRSLTRECMDEFETHICRLLDGTQSQGTIIRYSLFVDKRYEKRMQGICDIILDLIPAGSTEACRIQLDAHPWFPPFER